MKMRTPTNKEYDKLVALTDGANEKMHWERMYSWVNDTEDEFELPEGGRAVRGYPSARDWGGNNASYRDVFVGFRPAIEALPTDALPSEGEPCVIGTLYMDGEPVKVPQNPTWDGDIADYVPGTKLEMRASLDDPDYQVKGFHLGNGVFVADRVLLKYISYLDIEERTINSETENPSANQCEFQWILKFISEGASSMECTTDSRPYSSVFRHQLQALWTSFCLRYNLDVDTAPYDICIRTIFEAVRKIIPAEEPFVFEAFDLFMGEYLC